MLDPTTWSIVNWPRSQQPLLLVIVDAEAEFDWSKKNARKAAGVKSVKDQQAAQRIYARFGLHPTYMVDYPVSSQEQGFGPLRELRQKGECQIGAHLQPWDTPPFVEALNEYNSYPGNLPPAIERDKLVRLTDMIESSFGERPRIYKAGRYGVGHATERILAELGYEIDVSVLPGTDLRPFLGPDFTRCGTAPYWFGDGSRMFEIPLCIGFTGLLAKHGVTIHHSAWGEGSIRFHIPGVLARLHLLVRITLTPEGVTLNELRRLTRAQVRKGQRVFSLTYHSPSLGIGNTPYVRTQRDLDAFLGRIEGYLDFFMGEIGGRPSTPHEVRALAMNLANAPIRAAAE